MTQQISHYQIKEELGRGGMATVYRALDTRFEREVALKILPPYFMHDPDFPRRFRREAKVIASLEHKAIVPVYDYGEEDGRAFLAMRFMKGGSLAEKIASGALSLDETMPIMERIAAALDFAHSKGVVHRDLKPGNILFDEFGEAFLADFGIAKLTEETTTFTNKSDIVGTPAYMSPEQIQGKKPDGRSDIYALGIILFEMLSGQQPYQSETPTGLWYMHVHEPIPFLYSLRPDLPKSVDSVIQKALSKDPEERYQSGADLIDALRNAEAVILLTKPVNRHKNGLIWGVVGLIILLILGWGSFQLFGNRDDMSQVEAQAAKTPLAVVSIATDTPTHTPTPIPTNTSTSEPTNTPSPTITTSPTPFINPAIPQWLNQIANNPIIPGVGLGGVELGQSESKAIEVLGAPIEGVKPIRGTKTENGYIPSETGADIFGYVLLYEFDGVSLVIFTPPDTRTIDGIRLFDTNYNRSRYIPHVEDVTIGDTKTQLIESFGSPISTVDHVTCPDNAPTTTYQYEGISFWFCENNELVYLIDILP